MKLLLFILMSVAVMGQDYNKQMQRMDWSKVDSLQLTDGTIIRVPPSWKNHKPTITDSYENNTIDLILAYADECYADSTLQHTYNPKWYDRCLRQIGNLADGYSFVIDCKDNSHYSFTHRTPTLEGFIEFIRKRMR